MTSHDPTTGGADEREEAQFAAALERFGTTLRSAAVWEGPTLDLGDRIISQIAALRDDSKGQTAMNAAPARLDEARRRRPAAWLRPGLTIAAAAVVAFAAGLLIGGGDDGGGREAMADVELAATDVAPGARAAGDVVADDAGYGFLLAVEGLPPAPDGSYYEGWVCNAECNTWVSIGTFHMRGGDGKVVLWSGVPIGEYPRIFVTAKVESSAERGEIVLEGTVTPR